jgi:pimeloyl-ACP methyl ester carboxylesterase
MENPMRTHISLVFGVLGFVLATTGGAFAQDRFFDSSGVRIRYVEQGSGDAVVLIHGNGGSLQGWIDSGVLPALARSYRVIAIDARGHGKSGKPHEARAYGREMGLDVIRLLDHLNLRRAHIIGYSMGASITATLLTTHPDRFMTATLGGAPGRFYWTDADTVRAEKEASEKERDCVSRSQMMRLAPPGQAPVSEEEFRKRSQACMANSDQDRLALAAVHRGMKDQAVTPEQVKAIRVPTLGVVGSRDPYLRGFQQLQTLRPAMKLVVIEGATHGTAMRTAEFLSAVREFLKSKPAETRLQ